MFRRPPKVPEFVPTPFPDSARMFFCIGAQKAGTTWLYDYLGAHPQCHFSRNKELHYFDVMAGHSTLSYEMRLDIVKEYAGRLTPTVGPTHRQHLRLVHETAELLTIYTGGGKGADRHAPYLKYLLRGRGRKPVVCDITPSYATLNRVQFADMASIGQARFAFIMRDPVARMWSQIRMAVQAQKLPKEQFADACAARAKHLMDSGRLPRIERADYVRTMAELESVVPADRIKYLFYEQLFDQSTADGICDFLDIERLPASTDKQVNRGRSLPIPEDIRHAFADAFAPQYRAMRDRFGDALPAAWNGARSAA
jgi:hypothetical protein